MLPLVGAVFVASLFGSLHCVGMCGPLALLASSAGAASNQRQRANLAAIVAYHGSRVVAYAAAGCIAGLVGAGVEHTGTLVGLQRAAAQLAGGSMLVIGLLGLVRLIGGTGHTVMLPQWLQRRLASGHAWARRQPAVPRAATIGLLTAILPCGWLAAFLIVAAGTARPSSGALVMAVFALGAVPALAAMALSVSLVLGRFRRAVPWCSALLVSAVGAMTLLHRSHIDLRSMADSAGVQTHAQSPTSSSSPTFPVSTRADASLSGLTAQIESLDQSRLPCCCDQATCTAETSSNQAVDHANR
ncbi:MAG: sulfite exporter TauE/SafE family protein [Aureliella sp.]